MNRPTYANLPRLRDMLHSQGLDAMVASSFENVYYLSGALIETQKRIPLRLGLVLYPREGDPTLIVSDIEESLARDESRISDVRFYVEFQQSPIELLSDVIREKGLVAGRLGIETRHLVAHYYAELEDALPQAELVPADRAMEDVRYVKTEAEIETITRAARATDQAIYEAFAATSIGETERLLALRMRNNILELGADNVRHCVLAAGENGLLAHHIPDDTTLVRGDTIRLDFGGNFDGYASDLARDAALGEPSAEQRRIYSQLREIQRDTIAFMKPGVLCSEVYHHCRRGFERAGLNFNMPHVGHGFGVGGGHEDPMLQPNCDRPIEASTVFCVEPLTNAWPHGVFHLEDTVLITDDGARILSDYADTSALFVIE